MQEYNRSGFAVDPSGFNDLPIGFPAGFFLLQSCHEISVYIWKIMSILPLISSVIISIHKQTWSLVVIKGICYSVYTF